MNEKRLLAYEYRKHAKPLPAAANFDNGARTSLAQTASALEGADAMNKAVLRPDKPNPAKSNTSIRQIRFLHQWLAGSSRPTESALLIRARTSGGRCGASQDRAAGESYGHLRTTMRRGVFKRVRRDSDLVAHFDGIDFPTARRHHGGRSHFECPFFRHARVIRYHHVEP
jgi:hypothetical protein